MKLKYKGEGTVSIDGAGSVTGGSTIEVAEKTGKALVKQSPELWEDGNPRPGPQRKRTAPQD